ncbi:Endoribonuclease [Aphelenchoides bicaudatus]|nr:Endoribonuclease [Aphelenchoides bicaudatus]
MFQNFVESRNFGKYFDYLKKTETYKLMQRSISTEFNIPEESQDKLIYSMWEQYFRNASNDLPNWYTFYLQEKVGKLRTERVVDQRGVYAAWFKDENGQTVKHTFFAGTSPEFDFVAFTLCALQTDRLRQAVKCSFNLNDNPVTAVVFARRVRDEITIMRAEARQANYLRNELSHHKKKKPNVTDTDFQNLVDEMWKADEDRAPPGYIELNWQKELKHGGRPLKPLFSFVNETLFERPIYQTQLKIYDKKLFVPAVCGDEKAMTGEKKSILQDFFDQLTSSKCFGLAYDYLKKNGYAKQDHDKFLAEVWNLWYGTYTRCSGPKGSSGFEHVFSGEQKGTSVDGQHNWVRYYLLEKAGQIQYYGYYGYEQNGQNIGTFSYKWQSALKEKGGFFFGTSPSFDFSLLTACVIAKSGSEGCRFAINNDQLFVTSFQNLCDGGHCIGTAYPGIVGV